MDEANFRIRDAGYDLFIYLRRTSSLCVGPDSQRIPYWCILISSLSGETRNNVGMARFAEPDKLDIKIT